MFIVSLWMTNSSYFLVASFLFFDKQFTFIEFIVVLRMTSSSNFLVASFLFFEEQCTFMCGSLYCGLPVPLISFWHSFFSSKNSLRICVDRCIVDDQFLLFPCGIISFFRRTVYVYVLSVVLWMTSSSYFLAASFHFFEEQSTFMCWSLYCGWPVHLISLWHLFFSSKNSLRLCVHRCIVDDLFLLFPCGILSSLRRTVYFYVLIIVLWMTSSSYFLAASFLFFEEQSTFMCWSLYCVWPVPLISLWHPFFSSNNCLRLCVDRCIMNDKFLLFPCGILSSLLRIVYVYMLFVVLWMTSSSYFLVSSFLFFEEQSTFMCWSLYCGWPVPLISLWNPFFSLTNSVRSYVDRCIVDDHFLLLLCCILSFLRRTVYVYVLTLYCGMTSSSYFLAASFLFFEEQSTFMCWSLYCVWPVLSYFLVASFLFFEQLSTFMCWSLYC